jgi:MFS family permease
MNTQEAGWSALLSRDNIVYTTTLGGGVLLYAVDMYITTTILPSAVKEIGGLGYYAWNTTLFVVAAILGSALSGRLLQAAGPRTAYAIAALIFAAGGIVCAMAPSMPVMLAGRSLQGLGGGSLYALAYVVIRMVLPEALWTRAVGLMSAIWGVATLVGPAVGGTFAELHAWRVAFWAVVPFSLAFAALAFVTLPRHDTDNPAKAGLPFVQLILLILAVLVLSTASAMPNLWWNMIGAAVSCVLVILLAVAEARAAHRILPRDAHRVGTPLAALYATLALLIVGMQPQIFVPYFLQVLHGQSPVAAGYLAALMAMGWTIGSVASANFSGHGTRRMVIAAPVMVAVALFALSILMPVVGGRWSTLLPICVFLVLAGVGIGQSWPHLVSRVFQAAPADERNRAAGAITTIQLFASAMGAAAAGLTANLAGLTVPGGMVGTSHAAFWVFAVFAFAPVLGLFTAWRAVRSTAAVVPDLAQEGVEGEPTHG